MPARRKKGERLLVELFVLGKWAHDRVSLFFSKVAELPRAKASHFHGIRSDRDKRVTMSAQENLM